MRRKTHEEFVTQMKEINPDIEIIGVYVNKRTKIEVKCKKDGHIWFPVADSLIQGHGCPECRLRSLPKFSRQNHLNAGHICNQDAFIKVMKEKNPTYTVIGTYFGNDKKIKMRCSKGHEWEAIANNLIRGAGCPHCKHSNGEDRVQRFLEENNIAFEPQYSFDHCKFKRALIFDFYLNDLNTVIEYDGEQHYRPVTFNGISQEKAEENFNKTQKRDVIKTKYCKDNNIRLIRIPFWDFDNIEEVLKREIIQH